MAKIPGEQPRITVRRPDQDIYNPDEARTVQTRAFYQMWRAGHRSTAQFHTHSPEKPTLDHELVVHANLAGQVVQFAQILAVDPSLILGPGGPVFQFEAVAKSAWALHDLLWSSWLPNLRPLAGLNDDTWALFLKIVQAMQEGDDAEDQIHAFATQMDLDLQTVQIRAAYYSREVVPEWHRWFTGLGEVALPRI